MRRAWVQTVLNSVVGELGGDVNGHVVEGEGHDEPPHSF
jgi:hypothetical protein